MNKALVLEPQKKSRELIVDVLREQGIKVHAFEGTSNVAKKVEQYEADLVIMDIEMPKFDGMKVLSEIKERAPEAKIVLLTSEAFKVRDRSLLEVYDYLTKPFDRNNIVSLLRDLVHHESPDARTLPSTVLTGHMLSDLHDRATGRLDAKLITEYLAVPLSSFSTSLDRSVPALHKNPAASSIQEALAPIARSIAILSRLLGSRENVRAWMNSPHPDLGNHTPLSFVLEGKATAVVDMLEAALAGQPS